MKSQSSAWQILRSSSIVGAASLVDALVGIVRVKVLALLLGPAGIGVIGIYHSIVGTAGSIAGLGFEYSAVREIASERAESDSHGLARTRSVLRRVPPLLGLLGALGLLAAAGSVSRLAFGDASHAGSIRILAAAVFCFVLTGAQTGLLSGYRRIGDLARITVLGGVASTLLVVGLVLWLGDAGLALAVALPSLVPLLAALGFARRLPAAPGRASVSQTLRQSARLARLGVVAMSTSFMANAALLAIRSLISRELGETSVGFFQAAYALSSLAIGLLLRAMLADFYPRVSEQVARPDAAARLVNEQAEVALFLAGPLIVGLLTVSPLLLRALYSSDFLPAQQVLQWFLVGTLVKVAAWPLSVLLLANGVGKLIFACELTWNLVYLGAVWRGIGSFGVEIAGIGYLASQLWYLALQLLVARFAFGFRLARANGWLAGILLAASLGVLLAFARSAPAGYGLGGLATVALLGVALRVLASRVEAPQRIRAALTALRARRGGGGGS